MVPGVALLLCRFLIHLVIMRFKLPTFAQTGWLLWRVLLDVLIYGTLGLLLGYPWLDQSLWWTSYPVLQTNRPTNNQLNHRVRIEHLVKKTVPVMIVSK
jgi:hypothetical protein